jgi:hypothetical protein
MKIDIRRYLSLRDSLLKEKNNLEVRLREISQALDQTAPTTSTVSADAGAGTSPARRGRRKRGGGGGLSLRDAVLQVASGTPLTKEEILQRVQSLGYRFSTKNPLNSLGVILYGKNPKFRNDGGRFSTSGAKASPASGGGNQNSAAGTRGGRRKRRTMSPEARARIAAAQRARWAKARGGK